MNECNPSISFWRNRKTHVQQKYCQHSTGLCEACSLKLNYKHKRREIRRRVREERAAKKQKTKRDTDSDESEEEQKEEDEDSKPEEPVDIWKQPVKVTTEKDSEQEIDEYLEDLFL